MLPKTPSEYKKVFRPDMSVVTTVLASVSCTHRLAVTGNSGEEELWNCLHGDGRHDGRSAVPHKRA